MAVAILFWLLLRSEQASDWATSEWIFAKLLLALNSVFEGLVFRPTALSLLRCDWSMEKEQVIGQRERQRQQREW